MVKTEKEVDGTTNVTENLSTRVCTTDGRRLHLPSRTGPAKANYPYSRSAVISSALLNLRLCQSLENTWLERKSLESMGKCSRASTSFDIKG